MFEGFQTTARIRVGLQCLAATLAALVLASCAVMPDIVASSSNGSRSTAAPQIIPANSLSLNADPLSTRTLSVTGGSAPFQFEVISGEGSVNASTGVFTPASRRGTSIVRVTDAANRTSQVTLNQIASRFNGVVRAIAVDGSGNGYFGGDFTAFNPTYAPGLIALDPTTGNLKTATCDFAGQLGGGSTVTAIAESGDSLYISGLFSSYAGTTVQNLIKVNKTTCELDTTFSQASGPSSSAVALVVSGTSLYLGGGFATYRGLPAQRLAKIDLTTGDLDSTFTQATGFDSYVQALAQSGTSLYVGGGFSVYRGQPAVRLAKIDLITGAMDTSHSWAGGLGFDLGVRTLLVSGSSLYAGGDFIDYRGHPAHKLAKLDLTTGELDSNFTDTAGFDYGVLALASSGSSLYVGGDFTTYRGQAALLLAKLDLATGDLDPAFTPVAELSVESMTVAGGALFIGGPFSEYGGAPAQGLAKLDLSTAALDTTFTGPTGLTTPTGTALPMAYAYSGSTLYVGGDFTHYRGTPAQRLAKVALSTGTLDTTFTQVNGMSDSVYALALSGQSLYAGGTFNTYRSQGAQKLCKIDLSTGDLDTGFTQATGMNASVNALAISGQSLYAGGQFSLYRSQTAERLAKIDLSTGDLDTGFTQATGMNALVNALAISGSSLYVGGAFATYRSQTAQRLAKLDLTTGDLDTGFTQATGMSASVSALAISGSSLYVGGGFATYRSQTAQRLAKLDLTTGDLDTAFTQATGLDSGVQALAVSGSSLYVGGGFATYRSQTAQRLAKLNLTTGDLDTAFTQATGMSNTVSSLAVSGTSLWVGGRIAAYRGVPVSAATAVDLNTGALAD